MSPAGWYKRTEKRRLSIAAKQRGEVEEYANQILHDQFDTWLQEQGLDEPLTEEETDAVWRAFEDGFGIR